MCFICEEFNDRSTNILNGLDTYYLRKTRQRGVNMCTALCIKSEEGKVFFGRNMDLAYSFNQSPIFFPRNYQYEDKATNETISIKKAILGMGTVIDNHPALAEAMNEKGLACAGLNFARYAYFESKPTPGKTNVTPYDFILWVLSSHESVEEVEENIKNIEIIDIPINQNTPIPTLHWMITDRSGKSIVVEKTKNKFIVHQNPVNVMTNDPTFDWHVTNLNEYMKLKPEHPKTVTWGEKELKGLGIGAGTLGMPGDFSSVSRFVRIAYLRAHMPVIKDDATAITQFFHMLDFVKMVRGGVITEEGQEDLTLYSSCMDLTQGIYYYKTYENNRINVVSMANEILDGSELKTFAYMNQQDMNAQN